MAEAKSVGLKPSTVQHGFRPSYTVLSAAHRDLVERTLRLDGAIGDSAVHADFLESLRRRAATLNTHATTSIEGNPLGTADVAAIAANPKSARKVPSELEIRNHLRYYQALATKPPASPLTEDEILLTHAMLMRGVLPSGVGAWKTNQNVIRDEATGQDVFYPTPPTRVVPEIRALISWYNASPLPTPIRVAIWAHEFECIHPFKDGNGRTGRALTHRLLITAGLTGMKYVALDAQFLAHKREYMDAIASVETVVWDYDRWIAFFLTCLEKAYLEAIEALRTYRKMPSELDGLKRAIVEWVVARGGSAFARADFLHAAPAAGYHHVSVSQALSVLVDMGYLEGRGQGRGKRYIPGPKLKESSAPKAPRPSAEPWFDIDRG